MNKIRGAVCLGCRGRVNGGDIRHERIEFRIEINVIRIWKIRVISEIGIGKIIRISRINWVLGIIIIRAVHVYRMCLQIRV